MDGDAVSERLRAVLDDVALACRMLDHVGLINFSGHISARDPDGGFWIHPGEIPRHQVRAERLVRLDLDGHPLAGEDRQPSEWPIHAEVYRLRPDVGSVAHLHAPWTISVGIARVEWMPVVQHGALFERMPVLEDSRHVDTPDRGAALARALGGARAALMRGHGSVVTGRGVRDCFKACLYMEENAEQLWRALAVGAPRPLPPDEVASGREQAEKSSSKLWRYYAERLASSAAG